MVSPLCTRSYIISLVPDTWLRGWPRTHCTALARARAVVGLRTPRRVRTRLRACTTRGVYVSGRENTVFVAGLIPSPSMAHRLACWHRMRDFGARHKPTLGVCGQSAVSSGTVRLRGRRGTLWLISCRFIPIICQPDEAEDDELEEEPLSDGKWPIAFDFAAVRGRISDFLMELSRGPGSLYSEIVNTPPDPTVHPEVEWDAEVRLGEDLCIAERAFIGERLRAMRKPFAALMGVDEKEVDERDIPVVAIAGSGGGKSLRRENRQECR